MKIRMWAIAIGIGTCLSSSFLSVYATAQTTDSPAANAPAVSASGDHPSPIHSFALVPSALVPSAINLPVQKKLTVAQANPSSASELNIENTLRFRPRWPLFTAFFLGVGAILLGIQQYRARCHVQRVDYARKAFEAFRQRPGVQTVMSILDFEEYRTQYYTHPLTGEVKHFEATDARLRRSFREHDAMVKIKSALLSGKHREGLHYSGREGDPPIFIDAETCRQYENDEFSAEVTLRNWFDEFLCGLEDIDAMIRGGLFTARDIKPFILYWIQVIANRSVRRKGGASFYDPLFYYIRHSGYTGVETLFERFGYKILPPPYNPTDFKRDPDVATISFNEKEENNTYRALCCAKASMLVYAGTDYMEDIVKLWLREDEEQDYRQQSNEEFLASIIHEWQNEQNTKTIDLDAVFEAFEDPDTDTQAFVFRKRNDLSEQDDIILVFRGTEKFQDWRTNISLTLRKFPKPGYAKTGMPPLTETSSGKIHRGFLNALKSIEPQVIAKLNTWEARLPSSKDPVTGSLKKPPKIWVTGHSLGGALAAIAAVSLKYQGFNIAGLYTFGQPRVGDWAFGRAAMKVLNQNGEIPVDRYANNNDIVPLIPPGFVPWQPTRIYGHFGQFRYFDLRGKLHKNSFLSQRWFDRGIGYLLAISKPGLDAVSDHSMEFYIDYLQKAVDEEKKEIKLEQSLDKKLGKEK